MATRAEPKLRNKFRAPGQSELRLLGQMPVGLKAAEVFPSI